MSLEQILNEMEQGEGQFKRDPELYFFSVFGKPGSTDPKQPWGWRVEGHHLSLNFTIAGDKGVAAGADVHRHQPRRGPERAAQGAARARRRRKTWAAAFVKSLTTSRGRRRSSPTEAPEGHHQLRAPKAKPLDPRGSPVTT